MIGVAGISHWLTTDPACKVCNLYLDTFTYRMSILCQEKFLTSGMTLRPRPCPWTLQVQAGSTVLNSLSPFKYSLTSLTTEDSLESDSWTMATPATRTTRLNHCNLMSFLFSMSTAKTAVVRIFSWYLTNGIISQREGYFSSLRAFPVPQCCNLTPDFGAKSLFQIVDQLISVLVCQRISCTPKKKNLLFCSQILGI